MGREIRKVVPGWEHPRYTEEDAPRSDRVGDYRPLYDQDYESAANEWLAGLLEWESGKRPEWMSEESKAEYKYYWDYNGSPPNKNYYRPKWETEPTWVQMYETVSEGTPVTPAFATKEELVEYLVEFGTYWDVSGVKRGYQTTAQWSRQAAEQFVKAEYAPSMVVTGGKIYEPRDGIPGNSN